MTDIKHIRDSVVLPGLLAVGLYSIAAEQLVMATGMAESGFRHKRQIARYTPAGQPVYGPARGWFQMEPATHNDIWVNFLGSSRRATILEGLRRICDRPGDPDELEHNQIYAAAMCRIFYVRISEALPPAGDLAGMARYWKRYYNTAHGKGTVEGFMAKAAPVFA